MTNPTINSFGATSNDRNGHEGAERRLEDHEARYQALIEHVPVATYAQLVERADSAVH